MSVKGVDVMGDKQAQDAADWIDSGILYDLYVEAGKVFGCAPVPLIGRYFWNPITREIEAGSARDSCG